MFNTEINSPVAIESLKCRVEFKDAVGKFNIPYWPDITTKYKSIFARTCPEGMFRLFFKI